MLNNVSLMGRLTKAPELKTTNNGTSVLSFTVACDRNYRDSDNNYPTDYFDCVAWKQTAEFIHGHFGKGDLIILEGNLQTQKYEDRDGNKRTKFEVVVNHSYFGQNRVSPPENPEQDVEPTGQPTIQYEDDDDLPF